jgi:regulation of enolase protein 1 (concanavalin A-like superfamily)
MTCSSLLYSLPNLGCILVVRIDNQSFLKCSIIAQDSIMLVSCNMIRNNIAIGTVERLLSEGY